MLSVCENKEQIALRLNAVAVRSLILSRKAEKLNKLINNSNVQYLPYSHKSLGEFTQDLREIEDLTYEIGCFCETV